MHKIVATGERIMYEDKVLEALDKIYQKLKAIMLVLKSNKIKSLNREDDKNV
jgi:hypothetical protein